MPRNKYTSISAIVIIFCFVFLFDCIKCILFIFLFCFQKLDNLEKEEEIKEKAGFYADSESEDDEEMKNIRELAKK